MTERVWYLRMSTGHEMAYQLVGDADRSGPTVLFMPSWFTHLDMQWQDPALAVTLARVSTLGKMLLFDRCGVGLSERFEGGHVPPLSEQVDEMAELIEDVADGPVILIAANTSSFPAIELAATLPELVEDMVILGGSARLSCAEGYEFGWGPNEHEVAKNAALYTLDCWGTGKSLGIFDPGAPDNNFKDWYAAKERASATPKSAAAHQAALMRYDVRDRLPEVAARTLVIHREGDRAIGVEHGRYIVDHIPNAEWHRLPGQSNLCFGESSREWYERIRGFLGEKVEGGQLRPPVREFQALVFSDMVGSTPLVIERGDEQWGLTLERYMNGMSELRDAYGGTIQSMQGDGHLTCFPSASDAIAFARGLRQRAQHLGLELRIGIHAAEVDVADGQIVGQNIHLAARVETAARAGEIVVTDTVKAIVTGSEHRFEDHGVHELKGFSGPVNLSRLLD
jgi:class 3 adenylate cyclase/pimeloyl-ACP methyl ester carboxylesterase